MATETQLTAAQKEKLKLYEDTWFPKVFNNQRNTIEDAIKVFENFQVKVMDIERGIGPNKRTNGYPVVLLESPSECWQAVLMIDSGYIRNVKQKKNPTLGGRNPKNPDIFGDVMNQLKYQIDFDIQDVNSDNVIYDPSEKVKAANGEIIEKYDFVEPYFDPQFWVGWFAYNEFARIELGIPFNNLDAYLAFLDTHKYSMIFCLPFSNDPNKEDGLCIVCQPPTILKAKDYVRHCENGPCREFNGRDEAYFLNGIKMEPWQVMTPRSKLDPLKVLSISNVDQRREVIRLHGIEAFLNLLPHEVVDTKNEYSLLKVELFKSAGNTVIGTYLKMTNPSVEGVYHVEGVDNSCETVQQALNDRAKRLHTALKGRDWKPSVVT